LIKKHLNGKWTPATKVKGLLELKQAGSPEESTPQTRSKDKTVCRECGVKLSIANHVRFAGSICGICFNAPLQKKRRDEYERRIASVKQDGSSNSKKKFAEIAKQNRAIVDAVSARVDATHAQDGKYSLQSKFNLASAAGRQLGNEDKDVLAVWGLLLKEFREAKFACILFGVAIMVFGPLFLCFVTWGVPAINSDTLFSPELNAGKGVQAHGVIETRYRGSVDYSFTVHGTKHKGHGFAQSALAGAGDSIMIEYLPENPSINRPLGAQTKFEREIFWANIIFPIIGGGIMAFVVIVWRGISAIESGASTSDNPLSRNILKIGNII
jgi:hypothetical protein